MSRVRIPSQQATIFAGREIPFHGDGVSPRFSFNAPGEAVPAGTNFVFTKNATQGGTVVFSMRREEPAWDILWQIVREQDTLLPRPPASGVSMDLSDEANPQKVVWSDAVATGLPDFGMGASSEIVTFTFSLDGLKYL